jgi:purine-binding chemotaxis protein CheW
MMTAVGAGRGLVVTIGARACSVPLAHVIETMRPLPMEIVTGMPPFIRGLSIIRGSPVPVVDLAEGLGTNRSSGDRNEKGTPSRFVALRLGDRRVALLVDAVLGVRDIAGASLEDMPPLLRGASTEIIEAIGILDAELLVVLRATRILSEDVWQKLDARGGSP